MRMPSKANLTVTFAAVILLSALGIFTASQNLGSLNEAFRSTGSVQRIQAAVGLKNATLEVARDEERLVLAVDASTENRLISAMDAKIATIRDDTSRLVELSSEQGKPLADRFASAYEVYLVQHMEVRRLLRTGQERGAYILAIGEAAEARKLSVDALDDIVGLSTRQLASATGDAKALLPFLFAGLILIATVAACWIIVAMGRSLAAPGGRKPGFWATTSNHPRTPPMRRPAPWKKGRSNSRALPATSVSIPRWSSWGRRPTTPLPKTRAAASISMAASTNSTARSLNTGPHK